MTIDDILKIVQTIFYATASIVTVLTYRSVRKTLLNSVNTEYQKRVMDRLTQLSEQLLSEFDHDSVNYWAKEIPLEKIVDEINDVFLKNKATILEKGEFGAGHLVPKDWLKLRSLVSKIKTDPFIPIELRNTILDLLENRSLVLERTYRNTIEEYKLDLAKGKYQNDLSNNKYWLHNKVNDELYKQGCGISQIETEVHNIRLSIQKYFEEFNPIRK